MSGRIDEDRRRTHLFSNVIGARMKNVYEVLRQKELQISRLKKEVEALRVAVPLLSEDHDGNENKPRLASSTAPQPTRGP